MDTIQVLEDAIFQKKTIFIRYHGGSQPGTVREIIPTKISGDKVYAFCTLSKANKTFIVDKIDIEGFESSDSYCFDVDKKVIKYDTILEMIEALSNEWIKYGWHSYEYRDCYICLYGKNKIGEKKNFPSIELHSESSYGLVLTINLSDVNVSEPKDNISTKWKVHSDNNPSSTFKYLDKAIQRFIEYSEKTDPGKPDTYLENECKKDIIYKTIPEAIRVLKNEWKQLGYSIEYGKNFIKIFGKTKKGTVRKYPSAELEYRIISHDMDLKTEKAWTVYIPGEHGLYFKTPEKAIQCFIAYCKKYSNIGLVWEK